MPPPRRLHSSEVRARETNMEIREKQMKAYCKVTAMTCALLVVAFGLLWSTGSVSAAADGKITGTVKLDGAAPHMKGIDMSKDPYCVKQHENNPAHLENVVVGAGGGLENVVLYISEGLSATEASQVSSQVPVFDQKNCMYTPHVLRHEREPEVQSGHQRSDHPQYSSPAQPSRGKYSVEQIAAPGSSAD